MDHDKTAALRRVAIVLSSLPDATASRLLANLASDQQRALRLAVGSLADVDPLERRRALSGFAASIARGRSSLAGQNDAAEIVLSKVALQHPGATPSPDRSTSAPQPTSPLAFLSEVDDAQLARHVHEEHPQTIAIILASISPAKAARILPKLTVTTRSEAMRRLAKLDNPPAELVEDIGMQLRNKLLSAGAGGRAAAAMPVATGHADTASGQATLRAILAEMSNPDAPASVEVPRSTSDYPRLHRVADDRAAVASTTAADAVWPARTGFAADVADDPERSHGTLQGAWSPQDSTDAIHARLLAASAAKLREALAAVPTRQSLLALCGLPTATADKVLSSLPRKQARQIREQINSLGTLELREIDRAKEAVARALEHTELAIAG